MKLRFYAKGTALVRVPGSAPRVGSKPQYVGRRWDDTIHGFPATEKPHECESGTPEALRLMKLAQRDACLWPADEETARACGVVFKPVEFKDGVVAEKTTGKAS